MQMGAAETEPEVTLEPTGTSQLQLGWVRRQQRARRFGVAVQLDVGQHHCWWGVKGEPF